MRVHFHVLVAPAPISRLVVPRHAVPLSIFAMLILQILPVRVVFALVPLMPVVVVTIIVAVHANALAVVSIMLVQSQGRRRDQRGAQQYGTQKIFHHVPSS